MSRVTLQTHFCAAGSVSIRGNCERFVNNMRAGTNCACPRGAAILVFQISVQHGCELGAGGKAGGLELSVRALQDACAAGGVVFAENQTCGIRVIPAYQTRYGMVCHKQAHNAAPRPAARRSPCRGYPPQTGRNNICPAARTVVCAVQLRNACVTGNAAVCVQNDGR